MSHRVVRMGCVLLVLVLAVAVYAGQTKEAGQPSQVGRYQLVVYSNTLCKMDTSNGKIWVLTTGKEMELAPLLQAFGVDPQEIKWRELEDLYKGLSNASKR